MELANGASDIHRCATLPEYGAIWSVVFASMLKVLEELESEVIMMRRYRTQTCFFEMLASF